MRLALQKICAERGITLDAAQQHAADRLVRLNDELTVLRTARATLIGRVFVRPAVPRGVYLYGGVGRGKSFLMDAFYGASKHRRKTRIHFHAFMRHVHDDLRTLRHEADPLIAVAERETAVSQKYQ